MQEYYLWTVVDFQDFLIDVQHDVALDMKIAPSLRKDF